MSIPAETGVEVSEAIDLEELRSGIRSVLDVEATSERIHRHYDGDTGILAELKRITGELGWSALGIPEDHGGLGLGLRELAVLYRELGRGPVPLPFLSTMIVADIVARGGTPEQQARWLPAFAAATCFAALGLDGTVTLSGDRVTGRLDIVVDGGDAGVLLVRAGESYVLVPTDQPGVTVALLPVVDRTRSLASVTLEAAACERIAVDAEALAVHAALGVASDCIGGAEAILEKTIDYLKVRVQFGKPIGAFQALKHRVADHHLALELARSLLDTAVAAQDGGAEPAALAALARVQAAEVYAAIADDAVQLHGGIGFTWEHDCHLYLKRARLNEMLYGDAERHLDRAADHLMEQTA